MKVSILGLMDLGFRHVSGDEASEEIDGFNPWFNGFRF